MAVWRQQHFEGIGVLEVHRSRRFINALENAVGFVESINVDATVQRQYCSHSLSLQELVIEQLGGIRTAHQNRVGRESASDVHRIHDAVRFVLRRERGEILPNFVDSASPFLGKNNFLSFPNGSGRRRIFKKWP